MRIGAWTYFPMAFVLLAATQAAAQSVPPPPAAALPAAPPQNPSPFPPGVEAAMPLGASELADLNGRQGTTITVLSDQDLRAVNRGNAITAQNVGSGQIIIGENAFQGFAGVGNFVINSGHNNNLQGALTINIVPR